MFVACYENTLKARAVVDPLQTFEAVSPCNAAPRLTSELDGKTRKNPSRLASLFLFRFLLRLFLLPEHVFLPPFTRWPGQVGDEDDGAETIEALAAISVDPMVV